MILIAHNQEGFLKEAASLFIEAARTAKEKEGRFTVALSGGKTPTELFSLLSDEYYKTRIPWNDTYFFWVDERCVPPQHEESNFGTVQKNLFSKIGVPASHIFRIPGEMKTSREAATAYEASMKAFFKLDKSFPKFNLVLLGLGEDGHTASLFPNTVALNEKYKWAVANQAPHLKTERVTLTFPVINNAKKVVVLCSGENKANIVREIFRSDISSERYPAQSINPSNGELVWLFDTLSASKLQTEIKKDAKYV